LAENSFARISNQPIKTMILVVEPRDGACFKDSNDRILETHIGDFKDSNSMEVCIAACEGYKYAGTQYSHQCFCGNDKPDAALERPAGECKSVCPGNAEEKCGASWRMNIYDTSGKNKKICKILKS